MKEEDRLFYERRLADERERAAAASSPEAASAHRLLAEIYAHRLDEPAFTWRPRSRFDQPNPKSK